MVKRSYLNQIRKLEKVPNVVKEAISTIKYNERVSVLKNQGAIKLSEIGKDFEKLSYDIWQKKIEPDAGSIWKLTTIKGVNGNDEKWIVLYTGEDGKIIRQVKASLKKEKDPSMKKIADRREVEFFRIPEDYDPETPDGGKYEPGWYYWYLSKPGTLSDSDPIGPFETMDDAQLNWEDFEKEFEAQFDEPIRPDYFKVGDKVLLLDSDREGVIEKIYRVQDVYDNVEDLEHWKEMYGSEYLSWNRNDVVSVLIDVGENVSVEKFVNEIQKTPSKLSYKPGTIVQIDIPVGGLYERYNGKIGEVVAAVPDRSKVIFKDMPSMIFEDDKIRQISTCSVCNADIYLQTIKKAGKVKCVCGASYNIRRLERIAQNNRINKIASEKIKKTSVLSENKSEYIDAVVNEEGTAAGDMADALFSGMSLVNSKFDKEDLSILEELLDFALQRDDELSRFLIDEIGDYFKEIGFEGYSSVKKAQNVIMWFDDPKALKMLRHLQAPPNSPGGETEVEKEEGIEPVEDLDEEGTDKEASKQSYHIVTETCPKCGSTMTMGASHSEEGGLQWECHNCGYIEQVKRGSKKKAEHDALITNYTNEDAKRIGDSLGIDWSKVNSEEFTKGLNVEVEHSGVVGEGNTTNYAKIALDHLNELPDYYTKLEQMEGSEDRGKEASIRKEAVEVSVGDVIDDIQEDRYFDTLLKENDWNAEKALSVWLDEHKYKATDEEFHNIIELLYHPEYYEILHLNYEVEVDKNWDNLNELEYLLKDLEIDYGHEKMKAQQQRGDERYMHDLAGYLEAVKNRVEELKAVKEGTIKKKADELETLRGSGQGSGSDKLEPMGWTNQESKRPPLPVQSEEQETAEPETEDVGKIHVIVDPDTHEVNVNFENDEGEKGEPTQSENEPLPETTEEPQTEDVGEETEKEEGTEPNSPVVF